MKKTLDNIGYILYHENKQIMKGKLVGKKNLLLNFIKKPMAQNLPVNLF
jgi:hypothetical protein